MRVSSRGLAPLAGGGALSLLEMLPVVPAPPTWVWSLPCRWQDSHWLQDTVSLSLFLWQESGYPNPHATTSELLVDMFPAMV